MASTESLSRMFVTYQTVSFYRALLPAPLWSYATTCSLSLCHMSYWFIIYLPFGIDILCTGIDTGWRWLVWLLSMCSQHVLRTFLSSCAKGGHQYRLSTWTVVHLSFYDVFSCWCYDFCHEYFLGGKCFAKTQATDLAHARPPQMPCITLFIISQQGILMCICEHTHTHTYRWSWMMTRRRRH